MNLLHDAQARAIGDQIKTINALSRGGAVVSAKRILRYSLPMIRSLLQSELSLPQYGPVLCVQGEASRENKREPHIKPFPSLLASSQTPSIPIAWGFYCPITSSSHAQVSRQMAQFPRGPSRREDVRGLSDSSRPSLPDGGAWRL